MSAKKDAVATIAIADRFHAEALASLKTNPALNVVPFDEASRPELQALIVRSKTKINEAFLATVPRLKALVTATVGFDHIDIKACATRGVRIAHCPDSHTAATAEHTFALVLACARKIPDINIAVHEGDWTRDRHVGIELSGKTYGVIGLGRIGSRVARIAQGFGMKVVAFDPFRDDSYFEERGATRVGLDELFHLANVISAHVPKTPETHHMIHSYRLGLLHAESILVNTSRGGVIKEEDLITHLRQKKHGRFGLDVFESEPLARDSGLLEWPQVIVSPHVGAHTAEAFRAVSYEAAQNLISLLTETPPTGPLPPPEEWYSAIRP
ncbi:MAG: hydroxyacid dehydrogenase [Bdellovibrionales bacterium]|nr:hydroxyacid dehydrogenase [Bdellovibrionales bacterium]